MRQRTTHPVCRPVGDSAVAVELGEAGSAELAARARGLWQRLQRQPFPGFREAVPTARGLLALYTPGTISSGDVCARLAELLTVDAGPVEPPQVHELPVLYGGEDGPDLKEVAERCKRTPAEVVALHAGADYEALMLGFMPGFAYLGPLAPELRLPRRATPRTRVRPGSVAIAADRTAVYPSASPGGWHVIGRTSLQLFDPLRDPPVRILAGDRVRFVPVAALPGAPPDAAESTLPTGAAAIEVLEGGLLTSVQDAGRPGWRRFGVATAGALDAPALLAANLALGNPEDAAGLECTLVGPRLRFLATTRFALCGGDLSAVLEREDLGTWPVPLGTPVLARAGSVLAFGERRAGARVYLAVAGGIDVPVRLGSRSTDLKAGFGGHAGRALRAGDRLALGHTAAPGREPAVRSAATLDDDLELRIVPGPQQDHFDEGALFALCGAVYTLSADSDRFGARLLGPRLASSGPGEIDSDGLLPGCIQVPADGQPIVALAEGPTTGGYPKIATIVSADVARLGQAVPGLTRLRFRVV